jgi:hypothetical protein
MVKIAAVVDSACLIGLERIGRLDLLPALRDPIFAPPAVNLVFVSQPAIGKGMGQWNEFNQAQSGFLYSFAPIPLPKASSSRSG